MVAWPFSTRLHSETRSNPFHTLFAQSLLHIRFFADFCHPLEQTTAILCNHRLTFARRKLTSSARICLYTHVGNMPETDRPIYIVQARSVCMQHVGRNAYWGGMLLSAMVSQPSKGSTAAGKCCSERLANDWHLGLIALASFLWPNATATRRAAASAFAASCRFQRPPVALGARPSAGCITLRRLLCA